MILKKIFKLTALLGLSLLVLSAVLVERPRATAAPPQRWAGQTIVTLTPSPTSEVPTATPPPPPTETPPPPTETPPPPPPTATPRPDVLLFPQLYIFRQDNYGEPNDSCSQAHPLRLNDPRPFLPEDRNDWYRFRTLSSGRLVVRVTDFAPLEGQVAVYRGSSCGEAITLRNNGDPGLTKTVDLGPQQPAAIYFVFVSNDGVLMDTPYQLTIEFTAGD